jgi:serine/threonine-protein kinase RsbW
MKTPGDQFMTMKQLERPIHSHLFSRGEAPVHAISIPSRIERLRDVHDRILSAMETFNFTPREALAVQLAVEEALVNSVKHGNSMDSDRQVHVRFRIDTEQAWIQIEDEGQGFDRDSVPDPTLPENLSRPSGRGLLLMSRFMDSVTFNESGNRVTLRKSRSRDVPGAGAE